MNWGWSPHFFTTKQTHNFQMLPLDDEMHCTHLQLAETKFTVTGCCYMLVVRKLLGRNSYVFSLHNSWVMCLHNGTCTMYFVPHNLWHPASKCIWHLLYLHTPTVWSLNSFPIGFEWCMHYARLQSGKCISTQYTVNPPSACCLTIPYHPLWFWMIDQKCASLQYQIRWWMHYSWPSIW